MLCWQFVSHLYDVATLGSASNRASFPDLSDCAAFARPPLYPRILTVYDSDPAGDLARAYLSQYPRVTLLSPFAHDLTDYWRSGGNFQSWLLARIPSMKSVKNVAS
jgi:hypothetical protein